MRRVRISIATGPISTPSSGGCGLATWAETQCTSTCTRPFPPRTAAALGRLCAFHGQMGMYVRALAYMMRHGSDGLRQVAEDAVLNANYIKARLMGVMSP